MSDEQKKANKARMAHYYIEQYRRLAESSFAAPTLLCDIESAVVNGRKLEGDELRKFIEGMSEQDRRTMIVDMGLVDMLKDMAKKQKGPTPCSHCGGNGYEP